MTDATPTTTGGFLGDPLDAFNPPAATDGCCSPDPGTGGGCCGTESTTGGCCEPAAADGCCA